MEQAKVDKVKDWARPRNVREVRKFLGFTGYYRHFIQDYSKMARPLLDLTKQATPWHWEDQHQQAFESLRDKMVSKPVLRQPDFSKTFYLQTDASKYGVGAVLSQDEGTQPVTPRKRHPVAYYSATFSPTKQNYDAHDLEFLGVTILPLAPGSPPCLPLLFPSRLTSHPTTSSPLGLHPPLAPFVSCHVHAPRDLPREP